MGPKKIPNASLMIKKARNTIELKKKLVAKYESGVRMADLTGCMGSPHQQSVPS